MYDFFKKNMFGKTAIVSLIFALIFTLFINISIAQATLTPCPKVGNTKVAGGTVTYDEVEKCIAEQEIGLPAVNASGFLFQFSLDDIVGLITTILLAFLVIFFTIKIIFAAYNWAKHDAQGKNKEEALKSIITGFIGILLGFSAYFVVVFFRAFFNADGQLLNCSNIYFRNAQVYNEIVSMQTIVTTPGGGALNANQEEFRRCIEVSGKRDALADPQKYNTFKLNVLNECGNVRGYYEYSVYNKRLNVYDRQKLNQCFVEQLKKV